MTTTQPSLFDLDPPDLVLNRPGATHGWKSHDTEVAAAESIKAVSGGIRRRVLERFALCSDYGQTGVEVEAALGLRRPSGSNRVTELCKLGYVAPTEKRRATGTGRLAVVFAISPAGYEALRAVKASA